MLKGAGMIRIFALGSLCLLAYGDLACAQPGGGSGSADYVMLTIAYVEECKQADALLRATCARIGAHLPDKHKGKCALPSEPFETRIASSYRTFRESHRAEIEENDARLAKLLKATHDAFEHQFAQVRAGKVSMFDLESLNRELTDRCVTVEREWLAPGRKQR
jgi:hypothetical protein